MIPRERIETACEIARLFLYGERWRDCARWCSRCNSYVPMVTLRVAARLDETTETTIFHRVEAGELHYQVRADGTLLVCLSSLLGVDQSFISTETVLAGGGFDAH
jgi:hypothetical protein